MKAWKTIVMAGATLALAAPVANATFDQTVSAKARHAKVVHHKRVAPKVTTKTTPRVLIIIAHLPVGTPVPTGDDCVQSGNNCTDQQLCDLWGMNCDLVAVNSPSQVATEAQNTTN
jgi:hypothetical protein